MEACSATKEEQEKAGVRWSVDDEVYPIFQVLSSDNEVFSRKAALWIPDLDKSRCYVLSEELKERFGDPYAWVEASSSGLGKASRLTIAGAAEKSAAYGEREICCLPEIVALRSRVGDHGTVVRVHALKGDYPSMPKLAPFYPARSASTGAIDLDGEATLDPLSFAGALVGEKGCYILWKDQDDEVRGWEEVPDLKESLRETRYAVRGSNLYTVGEEHEEFPGFAEVSEVRELEGLVRSRGLGSASLGF